MQAVSLVLLGRSGRGPAAEKAAAASLDGSSLLRIMQCDTSMADEAAAACACSPVSYPCHAAVSFLILYCVTLILCLSTVASRSGAVMPTQGVSQPWAGFLHAGGVLADGLVPKQTAASLRAVFGPKVSFWSDILSLSFDGSHA